MQIRFLLGPSGVGKTWDCLDAVRREVLRNPEGEPLVFITPKQATFQIERQLLSDPALAGFSRLRVLSFERLATWILEQAGKGLPKLVHGEGRVMVLRALLAAGGESLKIFRASATSQGFAQQLSETIGRAKRFGITAEMLERAAADARDTVTRNKLEDVSWALRAYEVWLAKQEAGDADDLLKLAVEAMDQPGFTLRIQALWLDGFAELTPIETSLLERLAQRSGEMTLAFNVTDENSDTSWLSPWDIANRSVERVRRSLTAAGRDIVIDRKKADHAKGRFAASEALWSIERHWNYSAPLSQPTSGSVRIFQCSTREAEAVAAAREIRKFVREGKGRYRDVAVLVRDLEAYHDVISRVFARYEVPCFIDRREPVGHHPLAELTRSALRTVAFGWRHDDWFGALKTGLAHNDPSAIDTLENDALAYGWSDRVWTTGIPERHDGDGALEKLRKELIAPFKRLGKALENAPNGNELADALLDFWSKLRVEKELQAWTADRNEPVHAAFWTQMQEWIADVRFAFGGIRLRLSEWIPVIESGLSAQTVGLISTLR